MRQREAQRDREPRASTPMSRKSKKRRRGREVAIESQNQALAAESDSQGSPAGKDVAQNAEPGRWLAMVVCALLVTLVFVTFGKTIGYGFVNFDDNLDVYDNPAVSNGFTISGWRWAFTENKIDHWHPLTWVSHMLDCQVYGLWAGGHHLTNILLHAASAVLLYLIFLRMTRCPWRCAFLAAAWAIHPLRVESVAWVSERKDVLSSLFFMLTLGAYLRYLGRPSVLRQVCVAVLFALGLLSKNMIVTFPCLLLLLDYWPLGRLNENTRIHRLLMEKSPLFILSALSAAITLLEPREVHAVDRLPILPRIEGALAACWIYLRQTVWPTCLAPFYPYRPHAVSILEAVVSLGFLCLVTGAAYGSRKRHPYFLVGWLWYLGMLVPVSGLVQISTYSHADRFTYLPQIGLWLAVTWGAAEWAGRLRVDRPLLGVASGAIVCTLVIISERQAAFWRDNITLWTHTLGCTAENSVARVNLGGALFELGQTEAAISQFRTAVQIRPGDVDAHCNLGYALCHEGRTREGVSEYRQALRINPDDSDVHSKLGDALLQEGQISEAIAECSEAVKIRPFSSKAHISLGTVLCQAGRVDEAMAEFRVALQINPSDTAADLGLGNVLLQQGDTAGAIGQYEQALRLDPTLVDAHYNLAHVFLQQGRRDEAIAEYRVVIRINPGNAQALYNLGNALFQRGDSGEAIAHMEEASRLQPVNGAIQNSLAWMLATAPQHSLRNGARAVQFAGQASHDTGTENPIILRTLAAAYAQAGDFADAVKTAEDAVQLAGSQGNTALAAALPREIALYKAGHSFEAAR